MNNLTRASLSLHPVGGVIHAAGGDGAWEDWDVSANVPAGGIALVIIRVGAGPSINGVRQLGSAVDTSFNNTGNVFYMAYTNSAGVLSVICANHLITDFVLIGYLS